MTIYNTKYGAKPVISQLTAEDVARAELDRNQKLRGVQANVSMVADRMRAAIDAGSGGLDSQTARLAMLELERQGALVPSPAYRAAWAEFESANPQYAGVQGNRNIIDMEILRLGADFCLETINRAAHTVGLAISPAWQARQTAAAEEQARQKYLAEGKANSDREIASMKVQLLAHVQDANGNRKVHISPRHWADETLRVNALSDEQVRQEIGIRNENTRRQNLTVDELRKLRDEETVTRQQPSMYAPLPDLYTHPTRSSVPPRAWTVQLLKELGNCPSSSPIFRSELHRCIRVYSADSINQKVAENAAKGVV